jgi:hypothetical protein
MPSNHFVHKRTRARYSSEKSALMNKARWDAERERRELDLPERLRYLAEIDTQNLPRKKGDALGCLQWTDFTTGKVRRWTVRIGDRIDRITLESPDGRKTGSHGWSWALDHLRGLLAGRK